MPATDAPAAMPIELGAVLTPPPGSGWVRICLALGAEARRSARELVERRYAWRGYQVGGHDPSVCTFVAHAREDRVVGTVGVRMDARRVAQPCGDATAMLAADKLHRGELAALRAAGARLCEFTRLALDLRAAGKPVLARLFHSAYLYAALICGATHAVIEVNPRHVRFYESALGFERLSEVRMNRAVEAPAVLLAASFADVRAALAEVSARPATDHNLYPHGWTRQEEPGVLRRLADAFTGERAPVALAA